MTRLRLLLLLLGAGLLLTGTPAAGAVPADPDGSVSAPAPPDPALQLLRAAAQAAVTRSYTGTQFVSTWRADQVSSSIADVRHTPSGGSVVHVQPTVGGDGAQGQVTLGTDLDLRLLSLLADHYRLRLAGSASCTGRPAYVVEATRRGDPGAGAVAARFWVDADSSLVLRREVFDRSGQLVRSSAFVTLTVAPAAAHPPAPVPPAARPTAADIARLRAQGWRVPAQLPDELTLYDARLATGSGQQVLHLSYSDGLSTLSLFAQHGQLGTQPMAGFTVETVGGVPAWVRASAPERVVWAGDGQVFTLLSDAPRETISAVVAALPHDPPPDSGVLARLGRGLARLASWLNPFG